MSDEADQPLTRRERRLRELGETGVIPTVALGTPAASDLAAQHAPHHATAESRESAHEDGGEIEISPFNEDGTPRSRREMRQLREQAVAERAARQQQSHDQLTAIFTESEVDAEPTDDASEPNLEETQPLSLEDLLEISDEAVQPGRTEKPDLAEIREDTEDRVDPELDLKTEARAEPEARRDSADADDLPPEQEPEGVRELDQAQKPEDGEDAIPTVESDPELEPEEQSAPVSAKKKSYTFPDIAPLDDTFSVFDDPNVVRTAVPGQARVGDFDDLISRAVAQEGAVGTTNSSALILPNLPDTGELAGPLGETGELFITGSIDLPKSLGETGGHAPLHDSLEFSGLDDLGLDEVMPDDDGIAPVAAKRAVSAVASGDAIVAQETKEQSKLPLVLILTGGGLVVAVGALLIWGASAGMFG